MAMTEKEKSCRELVKQNLKGRIEDLEKLWEAYKDGEEDRHSEELGNMFEYGLCFDYCPRGTWKDQKESFFRYQLSTGGPGDEFRFFCGPELEPYRIEYWYLDWFDGAEIVLSGGEEKLLTEIWEWFKEGGSVQQAIEDSK